MNKDNLHTVAPAYNSTPSKRHSFYGVRFQMYQDNIILLNCPSRETTPFINSSPDSKCNL